MIAMSAETNNDKTEKRGRVSKKNSLSRESVDKIVAGSPSYEKASFLVVGYKGGVRIAIPKTGGVSRVYFYGMGDYSLVPLHTALKTFSEEERKELRKGGIMAEVLFDDLVLAAEALTLLVAVVNRATAPVRKVKKPRLPKVDAEATAAE